MQFKLTAFYAFGRQTPLEFDRIRSLDSGESNGLDEQILSESDDLPDSNELFRDFEGR
jgi:hypothetical protein